MAMMQTETKPREMTLRFRHRASRSDPLSGTEIYIDGVESLI